MAQLRLLQNPEHLSVAEARRLLAQFICFEAMPSLTLEEAQQVRAALQFLTDQSDFQTFGVCADSVEQGQQALKQYLIGLGHAVYIEVVPVQGASYIKYNLRNGKCYAEEYTGTARGVLVTCHGAENDEVNRTYGHLPLDLFAENL